MHRSALNSRVSLIILILSLKIALDVSYVYLVVPFFSWTPSRYPLDLNVLKVLESYMLTLGLSLLLPSRIKKPSDFLVVLMFVVPIVPIFSLYGLADRSRPYTYMIALAFITILAALRVMPRLRIRTVRGGPLLGLWISTLGVLSALVVFLIKQGGFYYLTLDLLDIKQLYEVRETVIASLAGAGLLSYVPFWAYYVFMPALMVVALHRKHYSLFILLAGIQLLFFGLSARRGVLLALLMLVGIYVIIQRRFAIHIMIAGFLSLIVASTVGALIGGQFLPASLVLERFFFTPARLSYAYYEFFSASGFVYLTNTLIPVPLSYPFDKIPTLLVGEKILHANTVASAGWLATSYMHFGYQGMIIFAMILGIMLRIIDSLVESRMSYRLGVPLAAIPFYSLFTSADLTTALLTYGIFPMMLLLWALGLQKPSIWRRHGEKWWNINKG